MQFEVRSAIPADKSIEPHIFLCVPWIDNAVAHTLPRPHLAISMTAQDARAIAADLIAHADKIEGK